MLEYGEEHMDFIERWFGIAPDGGDGSLEFTWILLAVLIAAGVIVVRRLRSRAEAQSRDGHSRFPKRTNG